MSKTILITGTSSGLGKQIAKFFANQGWNVAATMRNPEKETELISIKDIRIYKMDVTDPVSITSAIQQAIESFGVIDVVVNNAGVAFYGALELAKEEEIDKIWNTNVRGVINVIRAVMPHFRERKKGMFINIGSAMGLTTVMPLLSLYHTTKYALEGLTEGLYYELKPLGIDVHMIEPGGFSSELNNGVVFNRRKDLKAYDSITDKIEEFMSNYDKLPLGTKEEIIDVIYSLSTGTSSKFRTVVGEAANNLVDYRKSTATEVFLDSSLKNFL